MEEVFGLRHGISLPIVCNLMSPFVELKAFSIFPLTLCVERTEQIVFSIAGKVDVQSRIQS
jgi:hypothetical protein